MWCNLGEIPILTDGKAVSWDSAENASVGLTVGFANVYTPVCTIHLGDYQLVCHLPSDVCVLKDLNEEFIDLLLNFLKITLNFHSGSSVNWKKWERAAQHDYQKCKISRWQKEGCTTKTLYTSFDCCLVCDTSHEYEGGNTFDCSAKWPILVHR